MKKIFLSLFVLSFMLPAFASAASFDVSMKYGSRGDAVSSLQDFLQDQGVYTGKIDGKFGLGTRKAVIAFQIANNLQGDGYFGLASRTKANEILSGLNASSDAAEQLETGSVSIISDVNGCTTTSLYSVKTGQPCNRSVQPITGLPDGCIAISGYSVTTGQKCNGNIQQPVSDSGTQSTITALTNQIKTLTQQLQDQNTNLNNTLNTVAQNTNTVAQNTTPPPPFSSQAVTLQGEKDSSFQDVNFSNLPIGMLFGRKIGSFILRNNSSNKVNVTGVVSSLFDGNGQALSSNTSPRVTSFGSIRTSAYSCVDTGAQSCASNYQQPSSKNYFPTNFILNPGETKVVDITIDFQANSSTEGGLVDVTLEATGTTTQ